MDETTQVLIVGGSSVGMSAAVFLSHHGIPCVVIEKKPGPSSHPGFRGLSARTMELYRGAGVEDTIHADSGAQHRTGSVARARNLADPDVQWMDAILPWSDGVEQLSPCVYTTCDQDVLEPILGDRAVALGADVRFGTELGEFDQDADGVRAVVRDLLDGSEQILHAAYLVAADGMRSPVRETLGIAQTGAGVLEHRLNVLFTCDLEPTLQGRDLTACLVSDINGTLVPRASGPWLMSVAYRPEAGERIEDFVRERCVGLIRTATGRPDLAATVTDVLPWRPAALMAERFREGRVFLVGDAAHVMPPTGGFGGNNGIQGAYNLAWKLAAVLRGEADPTLLDTYEVERRPVAEATTVESLLRMRSWFKTDVALPDREPMLDNTVMFGYRYHSTAVAVEESDEDVMFDDVLAPTAGPGTRAPHLRIDVAGEQMSVLDLFGREFVLLAGPGADAWEAAGHRLAGDRGAKLATHRIGEQLSDVDGRWAAAYQVSDAGAVLVRPDGMIAWHAAGPPEGNPADALRLVLTRILRSPVAAESAEHAPAP